MFAAPVFLGVAFVVEEEEAFARLSRRGFGAAVSGSQLFDDPAAADDDAEADGDEVASPEAEDSPSESEETEEETSSEEASPDQRTDQQQIEENK